MLSLQKAAITNRFDISVSGLASTFCKFFIRPRSFRRIVLFFQTDTPNDWKKQGDVRGGYHQLHCPIDRSARAEALDSRLAGKLNFSVPEF
jgi:hypothetical protein